MCDVVSIFWHSWLYIFIWHDFHTWYLLCPASETDLIIPPVSAVIKVLFPGCETSLLIRRVKRDSSSSPEESISDGWLSIHCSSLTSQYLIWKRWQFDMGWYFKVLWRLEEGCVVRSRIFDWKKWNYNFKLFWLQHLTFKSIFKLLVFFNI